MTQKEKAEYSLSILINWASFYYNRCRRGKGEVSWNSRKVSCVCYFKITSGRHESIITASKVVRRWEIEKISRE